MDDMYDEFKREDDWEVSWPWLAPEDGDLEANTPWKEQPVHWLCYRGSDFEPWRVWGPVKEPCQAEVADTFMSFLKEHHAGRDLQIVVEEKPLTWFIELERV